MNNLQNIKNRFGIIGNYPALNRALEKAIQVAPTDISVLVIGESGTGKEFIPKIIHSESKRKHQPYIVVNCGAIPEGTIDSELFGHEKGAFTGATSTRKGYFEVADGGTIFLDEVGELPLQTQVRLLRVLESGEFMKVGSSQIQKTNVRIVAATNVNMMNAIQEGKFREDLYYRLNTVQVDMPPLRERKGDIHLLFRKFAIDFAEKYRMSELILTEDAVRYLESYSFPGNVRQLRNLVEQMTVVEQSRTINAERLAEYIPADNRLPVVSNHSKTNNNSDFSGDVVSDLIKKGYISAYFDFNSSTPQVSSTWALDIVVKYLKENSGANVLISGYADELGGTNYNNSLSQKRANAVKDILVKAGVSASRISTEGKGEDTSVDKSSSRARQIARRATFSLK